MFMGTSLSLFIEAPKGILPYKGWYPYNTTTTTGAFWSAYLHQIIAHAYGALTNAACDTLIYGMIIQICGQFAILQHRFHLLPKAIEAFGSNMASPEAQANWEKDELKNCIEHHLQILNYAGECNRVFDLIICVQFTISSIVLCVSVYRLAGISITSRDFPIIVLYLICMLSQIFILCISGSHVMYESHNTVYGIYAMDWTPLTLNTKKSLIFIIGRCLRPVKFTGGTILPVSIDSFNQLIKLSYSAFNVLQQTSGEDQ